MDEFKGSRVLRSLVERLARQTSKLQRMAVTIGTPRDTATFRDKLTEEKDVGMSLIHDIVRHIKQMQANGINPNVKAFENEARNFQEIIERIRDHESQVVSSSVVSAASQDDDLTVGLLSQGQIQVDGQVSQLEAKKKQIKHLEQDVTELATMFKDLQGLVNDQQETVDQIQVHVEETKAYTNNAASELEQADDTSAVLDEDNFAAA
eukprot:CAMPEP_0184480782 /NCGR_PEP_ID=MMETSP0113_2-20130426/2304_1 /TAXON_ID=91329 /ORGANISM="Norrisiella sphaerica, Strain BC52" /LENGTH=206 /DNA_ID=CAMNT_0026859501 /DNA_START=250 /DNA_END=871 /DNA_ORIENTATION=-